ncbi:MAG: N-acetylmuramoyl-L-alanine amidase CwlD [Planifilum sp.]
MGHRWKRLLEPPHRRRLLWAGILFIGLTVLGLWAIPQTFHPTAGPMPLSGRVIVLDPGHGGPDGGAVSKDGVVEKDVALNIALHLRDYLQEAGALVVMTREKDTDLADADTRGLSRRKVQDLMRRVRIVKESGAEIMVSIHLNAIPSPRWKGAQTFYHPESEENKKLASFIQAELIRTLENTDRLPKMNGDVFILRQSPVPAAMVEVGFLSNPEEAARLGDEKYQKKLAAAIYYGILRYSSEEDLPPEMK